jgi:hypothetical protein
VAASVYDILHFLNDYTRSILLLRAFSETSDIGIANQTKPKKITKTGATTIREALTFSDYSANRHS